MNCQNGRVGPPPRCLSPRGARHGQAARPATLSSAVQPSHPTSACDRSPHADLATAHKQPAAMHTAISSHTPPGQGDLGRETVVGSTPSIPMMAHITKWEPSSLPFPHTYTLLRCCRRPPSASSSGAIPSAVVHVRAGLFARGRPAAIGRQVRRDSGPPARTSCRTHPRLDALLGRPACVP